MSPLDSKPTREKALWNNRQRVKSYGLIVLILAATVLALWALGRSLTYAHGPIQLWSGNVWSDQNSQQLTDPYSIAHVTAGILIYLLLNRLLPKSSFWTKLTILIGIKALWEIVENTEPVIDRFRAVTISLGYYGDSIINSVSDIAAAVLGFIVASRVRVIVALGIVLLLELAILLLIRDGLLINILMLFWPNEAIKTWQLEIAPAFISGAGR